MSLSKKILSMSLLSACIVPFSFLHSSPLETTKNSHASSDQTHSQTAKSDASLVETLHNKAPKLDQKVLNLALEAYHKAETKGQVKNHHLTVIDFRLPSNKQRMWVFDLDSSSLDFNTYVAHGKNSGDTYAKHFSNTNSSKTSSLGTFITKNSYFGGKGYSLNLQGVEKGINDHALDRRIVIHGAWYMSPSFINNQGRAGRSWGCPAVDTKVAKPLINNIKDGSVVFAYYPDKEWFDKSQYIYT
jgi:hypothetical protein